MPEKLPPPPTHCSGQRFRPVLFSWCKPHLWLVVALALVAMVKDDSSGHILYSVSHVFHILPACACGFPPHSNVHSCFQWGIYALQILPSFSSLCSSWETVFAGTVWSLPASTFSVTWGKVDLMLIRTYCIALIHKHYCAPMFNHNFLFPDVFPNQTLFLLKQQKRAVFMTEAHTIHAPIMNLFQSPLVNF